MREYSGSAADFNNRLSIKMIYSYSANSAVLRSILFGLICILFVTEISAINCEYCNKGFVNADAVRRHPLYYINNNNNNNNIAAPLR